LEASIESASVMFNGSMYIPPYIIIPFLPLKNVWPFKPGGETV